jgi:hypothetical protein
MRPARKHLLYFILSDQNSMYQAGIRYGWEDTGPPFYSISVNTGMTSVLRHGCLKTEHKMLKFHVSTTSGLECQNYCRGTRGKQPVGCFPRAAGYENKALLVHLLAEALLS